MKIGQLANFAKEEPANNSILKVASVTSKDTYSAPDRVVHCTYVAVGVTHCSLGSVQLLMHREGCAIVLILLLCQYMRL